MAKRPPIYLSVLGPFNESDRWSLFLGEHTEKHDLTMRGALRLTRPYVKELAAAGWRDCVVWVRTREGARGQNACPIVWVRSGERQKKGPGRDAVKIGRVKIDELMDTITAHARMM